MYYLYTYIQSSFYYSEPYYKTCTFFYIHIHNGNSGTNICTHTIEDTYKYTKQENEALSSDIFHVAKKRTEITNIDRVLTAQNIISVLYI